jgi:hypothetical protein
MTEKVNQNNQLTKHLKSPSYSGVTILSHDINNNNAILLLDAIYPQVCTDSHTGTLSRPDKLERGIRKPFN